MTERARHDTLKGPCKSDAKLQARFSGNDENGKGLQQLAHVYVLDVMHELLKQNALIFNEQNLQCQARSWC
jgi:hypothetical protein